MGAFFKVSGNYKETAPYFKVAGNWKVAKEAWTKVSGSWKRFFLASGENDSTFNVENNAGGFDLDTSEIRFQSDGKIVVVGNFISYNAVTSNRIARLNYDGTLDTAFTTAIGTGFNGFVSAIEIQSDRKMVVGGYFTSFNGISSNYITRINPDGTRDTNFTINANSLNSLVTDVKIQPDGKIVVGGYFTQHGDVSSTSITRFNADGTRDTAFTTAIGTGFDGNIEAIAIQADGKIVVGGNFTTHNAVSSNFIARLNANGTRDTAFTTNIGTGFNSRVQAIAIQADGKIVVAGEFSTFNGVTSNYITKLNSNGTLDTEFTNNLSSGGADGIIYGLAVQSDQKIVAVGNFSTFNSQTTRGIARLNSDGTNDTIFNTDVGAKISTNLLNAVGIEPNQDIVIGGGSANVRFDGLLFGRILRIKKDSTVDSNFFARNIKGFDTTVNAIASQADGKIVVGGAFNICNGVTSNRIARLNTDGTLDTAFTTAMGTGVLGTPEVVAIQADQKIVAGGSFFSHNGVTSNRIARLNTNGSRDTAFTTAIGTGFNGITNSLAVQSDQKIVVGGQFTTHNGVTSNRIGRLETTGLRDTAFTTAIGTGFDGSVLALALQADGKIVVGGNFTTHNSVTSNRIARLNSDGTRDTTFTTNIGAGFNGTVSAISIQPDGKIVVGGIFTTHNAVTSNRIARLNADGTRDTTFTTNIGTGVNGSVTGIKILPDSKILIGGAFTTHNGVTSNRIARLNTDGTRDTAFTTAIGAGFNGSVNKLEVEADGKIVAVGSFIIFKNNNRYRIARLGGDMPA
jgi:uncharacterized delta-60 repeat protein